MLWWSQVNKTRNWLGEDREPSRIRCPVWADKRERSIYAEDCARTSIVNSSEHGGTDCISHLR